MNEPVVANLDLAHDYHEAQGAEGVYYQSFSRLAAFFGRDMHVHRHDHFFQMHVLNTGQIELFLDDQRYALQAPLFVLTPPSTPHAFFTEPDSEGHVLTVRQELIWPLLESLYPYQGGREAWLDIPRVCLSLADKPQELATLNHYWALIQREATAQLAGYEHTLALLAQAAFTLLLRNVPLGERNLCVMRGEIQRFRRFNQLIDTRYPEHLPVAEYARQLGITESRLADMCRRFTNRSPKRLIFERQLREAKRLLLFSDRSVHQIAYQLGFKDPAYFTRFFSRLAGCSPSVFRTRRLAGAG
ncbi:4-hydroxyphenylacetate catabolism regulatory protein HpaA [Edwardsiella tarda]|uniref:4-hydroxyphenylacetate catabolism regulatory protein HpaA n=1 Tax=Edwardsiella tarda TaxID=636 RepID=UPI001CEC42E2|nr:4-hydroxyphenylacetate catabolism regulatory protein HpaA [Edwardsiella tarda]UBU95274.1 4-hydroxyphenylacetate catabolism regulatory protein HpaA [Edwardsiella tarda]